jgi:uncharacterized protein YqgV (UPF0045/DUF77 family)
LTVRIEDHNGGIAREAGRGERVYLKNAQVGDFRSIARSFARIGPAGYSIRMRGAVEISMYPLTGEYRPPIQAFIDRLNTHPGLIVKTNHLATQIWGPLDRVMAILTEEMTRSAEGGVQLVFVMKVLPGLAPPTDGT